MLEPVRVSDTGMRGKNERISLNKSILRRQAACGRAIFFSFCLLRFAPLICSILFRCEFVLEK